MFYDGTSTPGGVCRVKKGDHAWLFLDKARKLGAELGIGGGDRSKRDWARVGVDDLMLVRGEIIVPHVSETLLLIHSKWSDMSSTMHSITLLSTKALDSMVVYLTFPLHRPLLRLKIPQKMVLPLTHL